MGHEIGPVQYLIVALPRQPVHGPDRTGARRPGRGRTIRIIDIAFVGKDENGKIGAFEIDDIDPEVRQGLENMGAQSGGLFNEEDLEAAAEELEPNSSAALLVWEELWAKEVAEAMRNAGGVLLDYDRIPHDVVVAAREWARANA